MRYRELESRIEFTGKQKGKETIFELLFSFFLFPSPPLLVPSLLFQKIKVPPVPMLGFRHLRDVFVFVLIHTYSTVQNINLPN